jgi:alpha-glucosidase
MDALKYNKEDARIVHYKGGDLTEFNFHNLNGFSEGVATNKALKEMGNKLPFIIL